MARQVPGEPYARITSQEAYKMVQSGDSTVVDVRNPHEWGAGRVDGAVWIPVDDIIPRFDELPGEGDLLFICEVGARSSLAAEYAAAMGADTSRLYNIEDGTPAWIAHPPRQATLKANNIPTQIATALPAQTLVAPTTGANSAGPKLAMSILPV